MIFVAPLKGARFSILIWFFGFDQPQVGSFSPLSPFPPLIFLPLISTLFQLKNQAA